MARGRKSPRISSLFAAAPVEDDDFPRSFRPAASPPATFSCPAPYRLSTIPAASHKIGLEGVKSLLTPFPRCLYGDHLCPGRLLHAETIKEWDDAPELKWRTREKPLCGNCKNLDNGVSRCVTGTRYPCRPCANKKVVCAMDIGQGTYWCGEWGLELLCKQETIQPSYPKAVASQVWLA
jgi:hypothetical protein